MQSYLKLYPKYMEFSHAAGRLTVNLIYLVEQYGLMTGPFKIIADFNPNIQDSDPWVVRCQNYPPYDGFFKDFFGYIDLYIRNNHKSSPFDDFQSGKIKHYEIYFPKMHYKHEKIKQAKFEMGALFRRDARRSSLTLAMLTT